MEKVLERDQRNTAAFISVLTILASLSCGDPGIFVTNYHGNSVPAALDIQSCEILALNKFESSSDELHASYDTAVRLGRIVQLKNGTNMNQIELLNFENKQLVPWSPPGPMTGEEEVRRHIGVYQWMSPKEGPYKDRRVCVSVSFRFAHNPPL